MSDADLIKEARKTVGRDVAPYTYNCELITRLADALERAENRLYWRDGNQGVTHYEGCWRDHYGCAMAKIEAMESVEAQSNRTPILKNSDQPLTAPFKCPINFEGCTRNCGSYSCGN